VDQVLLNLVQEEWPYGEDGRPTAGVAAKRRLNHAFDGQYLSGAGMQGSRRECVFERRFFRRETGFRGVGDDVTTVRRGNECAGREAGRRPVGGDRDLAGGGGGSCQEGLPGARG